MPLWLRGSNKHHNEQKKGETHYAQARRRVLIGGGALGSVAALGLAPAQAQTWPNRPVTIICPWGAGGGTDATARIVAAVLEKELKQPFNVVNRTGGSGVVGHSAIAASAPDGYTFGIITVEISMMHWQGLTELKPDSYTPLALMNEDPPGIQVNSNSPHKSVKELADAIKAASPGKLKASGTGQGGIWHLALVGWLTALGLKPDRIALCGALIALGVGRRYEQEAEADLAKIAAARGEANAGPLGSTRSAMALLPPALLLFYVLLVDRLGFLPTAAASF
jgi:hypothetical protein